MKPIHPIQTAALPPAIFRAWLGAGATAALLLLLPGVSAFAQKPAGAVIVTDRDGHVVAAQGPHKAVLEDPATPAPPAADPYRKEAAPAPPATEPTPQQVSILEEVFSLPIADAFALLHEAANDGERYHRLVKMTAEGKAKLERLMTLRTRNGQRMATESHDEYRYASEYGPSSFGTPVTDSQGKPRPALPTDPEIVHQDVIAASGPTPQGFETRYVGDSVEVEPVISPGGKLIELNIVPQRVRYIGDHEIQGPNPVRQPTFETQKITTSVSTKNGEPFLLGTISPPWHNGLAAEQPEHRIWLEFMTCQALWEDGSAAPPAPAAEAPKH